MLKILLLAKRIIAVTIVTRKLVQYIHTDFEVGGMKVAVCLFQKQPVPVENARATAHTLMLTHERLGGYLQAAANINTLLSNSNPHKKYPYSIIAFSFCFSIKRKKSPIDKV